MEEYDEGIDVVEFLKNETEYVAIVHPSNKNKKKVSAPLRLSNRMVSPKCCLCKGADLCVHLRIHKIHFDSQEKRIQENNSGDKRTTRSNDNDNEDDTNETIETEYNENEKLRIHPNITKDSSEKGEKDVNHFNIRIPFPLSEEDQEKFWDNSFKQNPYPDKFLYPQYKEKFRLEELYRVDNFFDFD